MSKINVVYIGKKPQKRIVQMGRPFLFPQGKPVAIEEDIAYNLLDFPDVFSTEEGAKNKIEELALAEEKENERKLKLKELAEKEQADLSWVVIVDGEEKDISKLTSAKLKTIIAAEELVVEVANVGLPEIREAVRAALRAKHGNPVDKA